MSVRSRLKNLVFFTAVPLAVMASSVSAHVAELKGVVQSGETPIAFSRVTLYRAGTARHEVVVLKRTRSDATGHFSLFYKAPSDAGAVLYLVAEGRPADEAGPEPGRKAGAIRLMTVLGKAGFPDDVVINERTTVAAAYSMARFIDGTRVFGKAPGLQNAALTGHNLVDISTGRVGRVLGLRPNGLQTSTLRQFNSLANMLAVCVNEARSCPRLLRLATTPGGDVPVDTLQAAVNIAHYPWHNVGRLFAYSRKSGLYGPALKAGAAPDAWTLAIRYNGNGHELGGPGLIAFDRHGNAWVANNYVFRPNPHKTACGSRLVTKLTPDGRDAPGAPYRGGGVYGAGFGITVDRKGDVWVGNFGFQGDGCPLNQNGQLQKSVSKFSPVGKALSPRRGFKQGGINQPQGMASDRQGNLWIANCGGNSVTRYPRGNPDRARNYQPRGRFGLDKPFDVAIDHKGNAWVTSNRTSSVVVLGPDGVPVLPPIGGRFIRHPMGIAIDSLGNAWVSNSGIMDPPCGGTEASDVIANLDNAEPHGAPGISVTMIRPDGKPSHGSPFRRTPRNERGGLFFPWGIAIDGDDNVWVANFGGHRVTQLCGARRKNCRPGSRTGDAISPDGGYSSDGLVRNTGVSIDPSGNVWLVNNWLQDPVQTNPGGHELVVFVGLAAPVKTPLLGPVRRP